MRYRGFVTWQPLSTATRPSRRGCKPSSKRREPGRIELLRFFRRKDPTTSWRRLTRQRPPAPPLSTFSASPVLNNNRELIMPRAAALRLPAIYQFAGIAEEGGFAAYGPRITTIYGELIARQLVKLLQGAKPADLPVEQPTKFELVINLKSAKAMGVEVPAAVVGARRRGDRVRGDSSSRPKFGRWSRSGLEPSPKRSRSSFHGQTAAVRKRTISRGPVRTKAMVRRKRVKKVIDLCKRRSAQARPSGGLTTHGHRKAATGSEICVRDAGCLGRRGSDHARRLRHRRQFDLELQSVQRQEALQARSHRGCAGRAAL